MFEPIRLVAPLATLALATAISAQTFTVIGIPDTQNYSENYPQIFYDHTQWIADNVNALNVRYVSHYGDLVQHGDRVGEWTVADRAMATLDSIDVPYGVTAGNHDITPSGSAGTPYIPQLYHQYFGPHRYAGRTWYRGASPTGMSSYQVFTAGGVQWLALHVECDGAIRELEWAQGVLDDNRDKPVLFTTHRYLQDAQDYTAGFPIVPSGRYPEIWYAIEGIYTPGGIKSEELWDWFIRRNPNILMVQCGHFHEEFRQTSTNVAGNPVHEILADYQDDPNGGNGWLRIMTFDLGSDEIRFESYSTNLNQFRTASESRFTLPSQFASYYETRPTAVLQQGINGYSGTQDTWINEDSGNSSYGNSSVIVSDDDTTNSIFGDERGQGLLRFDGLVGAPGQGAVPAGAQIRSAYLTVQVDNDVDYPFADPDFFVHRVLIPWDEGSTWNSLGGGLQSNELSSVIAILDGDNDPDGDGIRRLDVTSAVQAWVNGAPNYGFAILPEIIGGNDDGIEIRSSESGNPILRPRLEIVYEDACGYTGYGAGASPANTTNLVGYGLPAIGGAVDVEVQQVPSAINLIAFSYAQANVPLFGGVVLIDQAQIGAYTFGTSWYLPVPNNPSLAGLQLYFQSVSEDLTQSGNLAFSNGLRVEICR